MSETTGLNSNKRGTSRRYYAKVLYRVFVSLCYGFVLSVFVLFVLVGANDELVYTPGLLNAKLKQGMSFEQVQDALRLCSSKSPDSDGRLALADSRIARLISNAPSVTLQFEENRLSHINVRRRVGWKQEEEQIPLKSALIAGGGPQ